MVVTSDVLPINIPEPDKLLSPPIVALDDVSVGYVPGKPVLKNLNIRIDNDDRIALLGSNGNGKSTLVKLIAVAARADERQHHPSLAAEDRLFRAASAR